MFDRYRIWLLILILLQALEDTVVWIYLLAWTVICWFNYCISRMKLNESLVFGDVADQRVSNICNKKIFKINLASFRAIKN